MSTLDTTLGHRKEPNNEEFIKKKVSTGIAEDASATGLKVRVACQKGILNYQCGPFLPTIPEASAVSTGASIVSSGSASLLTPFLFLLC
jgi:hypothetical protein